MNCIIMHNLAALCRPTALPPPPPPPSPHVLPGQCRVGEEREEEEDEKEDDRRRRKGGNVEGKGGITER